MIVDTKTLLSLPRGTLFHNIESCAVYEIRQTTINNDDLYVCPLFHGEDDYLRRLHLDEMSETFKKTQQWYILTQEDKQKIARRMGFEPCGIMIIGLK